MTIEEILTINPKTLNNQLLLFVFGKATEMYNKSIPNYYKKDLFLYRAKVEFELLSRMRGE